MIKYLEEINPNDIFYDSLRRAINEFYDTVYIGSDGVRYRHLWVFEEYYDFNRFLNCDDLAKERIEFLTEVQNIVNDQFYWGE